MYPSKSNEECFSDQRTYSKSPQGMTSKCSKSYTESGQSFYESGRTDSGFLSGANLVSDQNLSSDDLSTPVSQSGDFNLKEKKTSETYMRLDSGVDVGLNEQFSALSLQQKVVDLNDLSCDVKSKCLTSPELLSNSNISEQVTNNKLKSSECSVQPVSQPWELYFQQDDDGDT